MTNSVLAGYIVPGHAQILLAPEKNAGWQSLHATYSKVAAEIKKLKPDVILVYSTQWPTIIGHQMQADPNPRWHIVDQDFHELGTIHYNLRIDSSFAEDYVSSAKERGLTARTVNYHGFPVDSGTAVALSLLNPKNEFPAGVVSCNMYADRAETIVLGKSALDAAKNSGKKIVAVAVTNLSSRQFTHWIDPQDDRIHSPKDDEWNLKFLDLLKQGRLEDVSQLARQFTTQANGDSRMRGVWWLSACMGQTNSLIGNVYDYQAVWGTGAALVSLSPGVSEGTNLEYDEDNTESYRGDRNVLSS